VEKLSELPLELVQFISRDESLSIEINEFNSGVNAFDLMLRAGQGIADHVKTLAGKGVTILAGGGNNGGDGIVAAGLLADTCDVKLVLVQTPKTEEAIQAMDILEGKEIEQFILGENISIDKVVKLLKASEIVIDALFGVGLHSEVRKPYNQLIAVFASLSNAHICSVDIPSGMDCNTGDWYTESFAPQSVVTMQYTKAGLKNLSSDTEVIVVDIGISDDACYYVGDGHLQRFWPKRDPNSHKGQNGQVLVIGGSDGFTGAPVLSGMAVLRSGVDTLRIAVPEIIRDIVAGYAEDFIILKVRGDKLTSKGFNRFKELAINRHDVIAIGMGISNHPDVTKFVREIFPYIQDKVKVVIDADAIRAFRGHLDLLKGSGAIITPHRAELRMMLGESVPKQLPELIEFLQKKAKELDIIILLKGRIDIITNGTRTILNRTGHPGMTVGGTGDVLAGIVSAANCFIKDPFFATAIAAFIMGKAGELAATKFGNALLASDVIKEIPNILLPLES
jgi:NAD(P)H-hydrate epimerase